MTMEAAPVKSEPSTSSEVQGLVSQGLSLRIAERVGEIFASGSLLPEELDSRAIDALREFNEDGAIEVLHQFSNSDLSHVQNKSAFLCGVMKTYREKSRHGPFATQETDDQKGPCLPDEEKIKALLERTGYTLDITVGQRKYGGPPPNYEGPAPGTSAEVSHDSFGLLFSTLYMPSTSRCGRSAIFQG